MKELDTENANGIADDDDLLMKEVIGEDSDLFFLDAYLRDILQTVSYTHLTLPTNSLV